MPKPCPMCGTPIEVVGDETKCYEPVLDGEVERLREALESIETETRLACRDPDSDSARTLHTVCRWAREALKDASDERGGNE